MNPFSLLKEIEHRSRAAALPLPQQVESIERWKGVGFMLAGRAFLASMDEVVEIITAPKVTMVPGVVSWVLGIANIRGELVPVTDLNQMLGATATRSNSQRLLIVSNEDDAQFGLVVDAVVGMQSFNLNQKQPLAEGEVVEELAPYVFSCFYQAERTWPIFDMAKLVQSQRFLSVAG